MTTKIASLGIPGDVIMSAGAGLDFSAASKGKFRGLEAICYILDTNTGTGNQDPIGGGGAGVKGDWKVDDKFLSGYLGGAAQVVDTSGIFSFATTGWYVVLCSMYALTGATGGLIQSAISATNDNGSTWHIKGITMHETTNGGVDGAESSLVLVKVSSIANDKVKLTQTGIGTAYHLGDGATTNHCSVYFIKLADI